MPSSSSPPSAEKNLELLCQYLGQLVSLSDKKWRKLTNEERNKVSTSAMMTAYTNLESWGIRRFSNCEEFERKSKKFIQDKKIIFGECDKADSKETNASRYVLLPPLEDHPNHILLLSLTCKVKSDKYRFQISMVTPSIGGDTPRIRFFKCRFENPEMNSTHDYFHAQLVHIDEVGDWVSPHIPCIPITASNPISAFLSVIIAFYGMKGFKEFREVCSSGIPGYYLKDFEGFHSPRDYCWRRNN